MNNDLDSLRTLVARATGTGWCAAYRQDVAALVAEVERLRYAMDIERANSITLQARVAMLDSHRADFLTTLERGYEEGVDAERVAVVAWLHDEEYHILALAIERGEHCREETP